MAANRTVYTPPTCENEQRLTVSEVPDFETVLQAVANAWAVQADEILRRCRYQEVAQARQTAMVICRKYLFASHAETGRRFGRDHATVTHAFKMWAWDMETGIGYAARYNRIIESLKG